MQKLRDLEKILDGMKRENERIQNKIYHNRQKALYKQMGYSSKCKTCNHPQLEQIEQLYNEHYSYKGIIEELGLEDISEMALSRHFTNHYPKSQLYKQKQRELALERLVTELNQYPFLESYFMDQDDDFIKEFVKHHGFCIDKMQLCPFIVPGKISSCNNIISATWSIAEKNLQRAYGDTKKISILVNAHNDVVKCLACKDQINEDRINLMELFIANALLDVDIANKEIYCSWLRAGIDKSEFVNDMFKAKGKE